MVTGTAPPRASAADTLLVAGLVGVPIVARGPILRRPRAVRTGTAVDIDRRSNALLSRLRARYGPGPLLLRVPGRSIALVLEPADVERVLRETPDPFSPATREKRGALAHFEPDGALISTGELRTERRQLNEEVLTADRPVHPLFGEMTLAVRQETTAMLTEATRSGHLSWSAFAETFGRIVRRVVLGDSARDDESVTDLLASLRADANWSYLRRERDHVRHAFLIKLAAYARRMEPGSLAGRMAGMVPVNRSSVGQIPQWLFAFDAAGISAYRCLALLATHPVQAGRVRDELGRADPQYPGDLAYLRGCVLDTVRLWPTTMVVLRDSLVETLWRDAIAPAGTSFMIVSSYFHRSDRLEFADRFAPEIWCDGTAARTDGLIPFSAGPAGCPGQNLVLLVTSTMLATMLDTHEFSLEPGPPLSRRPGPDRRLPHTLDHTGFRFAVYSSS